MVAISVLIRTVGRKAPLREALESLRSQSFRDFETVIVEDGPPTLQAFLAGYSDLALRYEALGENRGRSAAGNRALALAEGRYGIFLDDDDLFYPDHLRLLHLAVSQGAKVAYSWSEERRAERSADGVIVRHGKLKRYRRERFSLLALTAYNFLPINAVLFERALLIEAGGFDEGVECLEDWLLWLRLAAIAGDFVCVPYITTIYHMPMNINARRAAFRTHHPLVKEKMRSIRFTLSADAMHDDVRRNFGKAIFFRKLWHQAAGYLPGGA